MAERKNSVSPERADGVAASRGRLPAILAGIIVLLGMVAFHNALNGPFIFDDNVYIVEGDVIKQPLNEFNPYHRHTNRPVFFASLKLNYLFGGSLEPFGYHLFNVAVHLGTALVLFDLLRRTLLLPGLRDKFRRKAPWLAFAVAAIWVVHPLQTQAVNYVVQRCETMMAFCYLLFLYALLRSVESPRRWYAVSVIAFVVGIGCKEVMITAPVVALVFDRIFLAGRWDAIATGRKVVYVAILPAWLWLWFNAAGGIQSNVEKSGSRAEIASAPDGGTKSAVIESPTAEPDRTDVRRSRLPSPWQYLRTQPRVILHYIHLAFWPRPLCLDYKGGWPISTVSAAVLPGFVVGLLLCVTFVTLRFSPPIGFLAFSFFVILAPTSSVLPLPDVIFEHRMYLPLAALISIVVFGGGLLADRLLKKISATPKIRARGFGGCCVVVLVSLSAVTVARNRDYRSRSAIWKSVCDIYPENTRALQQLAAAHLAERNLEKARQVQAELEARTGGSEAAGENVFAINTKGQLLMASGDYAAAAGVFAEAVRLAPRDRTLHATVQMNLGVALGRLGRPQEAIERYRIAIKLKPGMVQPHSNLGAALLQMGKSDEAAVVLHEAVRLDPDDFHSLTHLGLALVRQKKLGEAVAFFRRAVAEEPQSIRGHDNLASVYIDTGQYAEAVRSLERAKSLAAQRGRDDDAESIRQRIERIRGAAAGRP